MAKSVMNALSKQFASIGAVQQEFTQERIEELEEEIKHLKNRVDNDPQKKALNQKLEALGAQLAQQNGEHEIPFEKIKPDPDQPRTVFPQELVQARAKSLREEGQLSPAIVIPQDGWYLLFDGEMRWRSGTLAGLTTLRCVFLTQDALDGLDRTALFDRQLTTSIQSEKLHPFDLANSLIKLIILKHPDLQAWTHEIPNILGAAVQRLKRNGKAAELDSIRIAGREQQQQWLSEAGLNSEQELQILSVILDKQLNPVSISSNAFPLLNLAPDLQEAIRTTGLEGSKILEIKRLSPKLLNTNEATAKKLRAELIRTVIQDQLSLSQIRMWVNQKIWDSNPTKPFALKTSKASKADVAIQAIQAIAPKKIEKARLLDLQKHLQEKLQEINELLKSN
jgi:ParB family transcriptional regulator, chromosome partitioning protein